MNSELHTSHLLRLMFKDSYSQFPVDLGTPSRMSSIIHNSGPQPTQQANAPRTNSRLDANLQLKAFAPQKSQTALKGDLKGKPTTEGSVRRRRDQNRAS